MRTHDGAAAELDEAVREIVRRVSAAADEVADRVVRRIRAEAPALARIDEDEPWSTHPASVRANVDAALAFILHGLPDGRLEPPAVTQERVRRMVAIGIELEAILRSYRVGHAELWARWQTEACRLGLSEDLLIGALSHGSQVMFAYIDHLSAVVSEEYARLQEMRVRSAAAVRADVVARLVAGADIDAESASRKLGYELRHRHIGLVIWRERPGESLSTADLERTATALTRRLGAGRPLTVNAGASVLWAWCIAREGASTDLLRGPEPWSPEPGVRVALGGPGAGVEGFVVSHQEALVTREHLCRSGARAPLAWYRDVALRSLLTVDDRRAGRYMREVLGPLAVDNDQMARLRATLALLLQEGGSRVRTARRLSLHQNSIAHRVTRIEELLGRSVDRDHGDLSAALTIAQALPHELRAEPER